MRCFALLLLLIATPALACEYDAGRGEYVTRTKSGERFATFYAGGAHYSISDHVTVSFSAMNFANIVANESAEDFTLHAAEGFLMSGYIVPLEELPLRWLGGGAKLDVEGHPDEPTVKVRAAVPCDAVTARVDPPDADLCCEERNDDWLEFVSGALGHRVVATGSVKPGLIPFSLIPDGPPVVVFERRDSPASAAVLEERGGWLRIAIPIKNAALLGWIDRKHYLRQRTDSTGRAVNMAFVDRRMSKPDRSVSCKADTPLYVELHGSREVVGTVHGGVSTAFVAADSAFLTVGLAKMENGARLQVSASECTVTR